MTLFLMTVEMPPPLHGWATEAFLWACLVAGVIVGILDRLGRSSRD